METERPMKAQHTPGPWIANDKDEVRSSENALLATVWDTYQKQENDGSTTFVSNNSKANAALIAAAPELMDALHKVLMALESVHNLYQMNTRKRIEQADDWAENAWNLIHKLTDE